MSIRTEIRRAIETLMIEHTAFAAAFAPLQQSIADTFAGHLPCFELLVGLSRCGKTELVKTLARDYPEVRVDGRRRVPLLVVSMPPGIAPKDLPRTVIKALGLPVPKTAKLGELNDHMFSVLHLAGVRVILFDEASHLVDVGNYIPPRAASDWFKDFQAEGKHFGIVLTGLPRLTRLLESNEQIRNRACKPLKLMPYRWDYEDQRNSFAGCVRAFLEEFQIRGCTLKMPLNEFSRHCYAASAGHIGLLAKFFYELASLITGPIELSVSLCAQACSKLNLPGNGIASPFAPDNLSDIQLMHVLASELERYDLVLPPTSAEAELAQAKVRSRARRVA